MDKMNSNDSVNTISHKINSSLSFHIRFDSNAYLNYYLYFFHSFEFNESSFIKKYAYIFCLKHISLFILADLHFIALEIILQMHKIFALLICIIQ